MYWKALLSLGLAVQWPRSHYFSSCRKKAVEVTSNEVLKAAETDEIAAPRKPSSRPSPPSVQHARLVGGHHVFDVDEGVLPSIALKGFQCLLNQVTNVLPLLLAVVNAISGVHWFRQTHKEAIISGKCPYKSHPSIQAFSLTLSRRHQQVTIPCDLAGILGLVTTLQKYRSSA